MLTIVWWYEWDLVGCIESWKVYKRYIKFTLSYWITPSSTLQWHHMGDMAFQITGNLTIQMLVQANNKGNIKTLLYWPFVRGIHRWLVDSPHKGPVMQKTVPYHDGTMMHRLYWGIDGQRNWEKQCNCSLSALPADGLALLNPRKSAGTMIIMFGRVYMYEQGLNIICLWCHPAGSESSVLKCQMLLVLNKWILMK